jgi:hypothetical protein
MEYAEEKSEFVGAYVTMKTKRVLRDVTFYKKQSMSAFMNEAIMEKLEREKNVLPEDWVEPK